MKLWPTITENKYFVKMLWHLLGEYVKVTVLLVCSICIVHRFFFFFPQSSICALFFYSVFVLFIHRFSLFICSSILVSHFFFFNSSYSTKWHCSYSSYIFFSLPFVLFFFFYIYCYTDTTNFIIFSQLLRSQFLISQNKIIKYKTITNHNWNIYKSANALNHCSYSALV